MDHNKVESECLGLKLKNLHLHILPRYFSLRLKTDALTGLDIENDCCPEST